MIAAVETSAPQAARLTWEGQMPSRVLPKRRIDGLIKRDLERMGFPHVSNAQLKTLAKIAAGQNVSGGMAGEALCRGEYLERSPTWPEPFYTITPRGQPDNRRAPGPRGHQHLDARPRHDRGLPPHRSGERADRDQARLPGVVQLAECLSGHLL